MQLCNEVTLYMTLAKLLISLVKCHLGSLRVTIYVEYIQNRERTPRVKGGIYRE